MARSAVNPIVQSYIGSVGLPTVEMPAEDAKTWKKGEFCFLTSGTVTPVVATGKTEVFGRFLEDQDTATSTSTVKVGRFQDGVMFLMYVMNAGTEAAIAQSNVGTRYGVEGLSNVTYLDLDTTNGQFEVTRLASEANPELQAYDGSFLTAPGLCYCTWRRSVS